jgi:hypothetical protein
LTLKETRRRVGIPRADQAAWAAHACGRSLTLRLLSTIGGDMHAVVVKVTINDREAAEKRLREETIPRVSQIPGVVAGYWTRSDATDGLSMVLFESEETARAAADQVPQMISEALTLESVEVREVVANI